MPKKTGTQKRKAKQTSGQEGQDLVEEYLGKLRNPEEAESIRYADSVKEKMDTVGTLIRVMVNFIKTESNKTFGKLFDDVITYVDLVISLKRHALDGVSHKDDERVAELEGKVKEKEEEIKRLGDRWLDLEEKLTGLRDMMLGKKEEIKKLKESAQKTERDFENFRVVAKAEAEEKDRLGSTEMSRRSDEKREEKKKFIKLQGEKERMELTIRDLEGSRVRTEEEVVALQQKSEVVESALHRAQDELGAERTKRVELEVVQKLLEDVEMGGTNLSPRKDTTDAATNMDKTTYARVAVQEEEKPEVPPPVSSTSNSKGKNLAAHPFGEKPRPEGKSVGSGGLRSQEVGNGGVPVVR